MIVKQKLSILVLPKWKKTDSEGLTPIYLRITIDGLQEELSTSVKVRRENWNEEIKQALPGTSNWKNINKKIGQTMLDLERHFDLMQAKNGAATAAMVKEAYLAPAAGQEAQKEKSENHLLGVELDGLIREYLSYCEKVKRAHADGRTPLPDHLQCLEQQKAKLKAQIDDFAKKANVLFDKKSRQKTLMLIIDEYLLNFLQLSFTGNRAYTTLEKWIGRKRRYQDFLRYRYKLEDIPLADIEYSFIEEVYKYLLVQHEVIENTAMKYAQCIKEMMDRAVAKGWISTNVFVIFKCQYEDTDRKWPTLAEVQTLIKTVFGRNKLNEIRDIFVFECFTGLSYAEMRRLSPSHIITGVDGKKWISINRQKTDGDETLPLLPIAAQILEKYGNHPICARRRCLLPVPTNEEYNRCLKEIAKEAGLVVYLTTHTARYFFANVVAFDNGVPLKIIAGMLGQDSIGTAAKYVKANKGNISKAMEKVSEAMFSEEGHLLPPPRLDKQVNAKQIELVPSGLLGGRVIAMPLRR